MRPLNYSVNRTLSRSRSANMHEYSSIRLMFTWFVFRGSLGASCSREFFWVPVLQKRVVWLDLGVFLLIYHHCI